VSRGYKDKHITACICCSNVHSRVGNSLENRGASEPDGPKLALCHSQRRGMWSGFMAPCQTGQCRCNSVQTRCRRPHLPLLSSAGASHTSTRPRLRHNGVEWSLRNSSHPLLGPKTLKNHAWDQSFWSPRPAVPRRAPRCALPRGARCVRAGDSPGPEHAGFMETDRAARRRTHAIPCPRIAVFPRINS